jgi:hypothetical protein
VNQIARRLVPRERFAELLRRPCLARHSQRGTGDRGSHALTDAGDCSPLPTSVNQSTSSERLLVVQSYMRNRPNDTQKAGFSPRRPCVECDTEALTCSFDPP